MRSPVAYVKTWLQAGTQQVATAWSDVCKESVVLQPPSLPPMSPKDHVLEYLPTCLPLMPPLFMCLCVFVCFLNFENPQVIPF